MEKLKRQLEHTYKEKERLERKIKSLKRQADSAFKQQLTLEENRDRRRKLSVDGYEGENLSRDELLGIEQRIASARQECEQASNELKEAKAKLPIAEKNYKSAVNEYATHYKKWLEKSWNQYRKMCEQADDFGDQLRKEAKFAAQFGKLPVASPYRKCLDTMRGAPGVMAEQSPENQLRRLKKIA